MGVWVVASVDWFAGWVCEWSECVCVTECVA
jgi:hypothetical protein